MDMTIVVALKGMSYALICTIYTLFLVLASALVMAGMILAFINTGKLLFKYITKSIGIVARKPVKKVVPESQPQITKKATVARMK